MSQRTRNLALTAWLGGFVAGPLPAAIVLWIEHDSRGAWHVRKAAQAALFWTVLIASWLSVIVVDIGFRSGPNGLFFAGWVLFVLIALSATGYNSVLVMRGGE